MKCDHPFNNHEAVVSTAEGEVCPLCRTSGTEFFFHDTKPRRRRRRSLRRKNPREYRRCIHCDLVYVTSVYLPDAATEKRIYDEHRNSPADQGYRRFLGRLFEPLVERLAPAATGLDFGCGPGPTLSVMFGEQGMDMQVYDPYYAPDTSVLHESYPFVTCTEVLEHLHHPASTLEKLWSLVAPGGLLGIMTSMRPGVEDFDTWKYKNDPTHVCFYSTATMAWLAQRWNAELEYVAHDAMILTRNDFK
ncbi:MAG: class I SAM-dependent methyltransferase [Geobacteraceae bacterium]|nr:class I SAM-dependent methyltransferase [Geobacteraceae bacterium]